MRGNKEHFEARVLELTRSNHNSEWWVGDLLARKEDVNRVKAFHFGRIFHEVIVLTLTSDVRFDHILTSLRVKNHTICDTLSGSY